MSQTQPKLAIRTTSKPLTTQYDVMFDRPIEGSQEFQEEMYVMRQALEGDLVNVYIDTHGGSCATVSTFQQLKAKSPAHFHGILQGNAYSAGSALFLLCDTQEVGDLAEMMIHTSQQGISGHSDEMQEFGNQSARTARKMMELVYKDFLSQEEIELCLVGKPFWLDSDQIKERLEHRQKVREDRLIEESKETYTPEFYARSVFADMLEDCAQFDYSLDEILGMVKGYSDELSEGESEEDGVFKVLDKEYVESVEDISELKDIANTLLIQYNYNISAGKLKKRILAYLEETEK